MASPLERAYAAHYAAKHSAVHTYPVEWVVRTFLGTYPSLHMDRARYSGSRVLDLGFGDGRNFPLFHNLGMRISGVEIADDIIEPVRRKFDALGIATDLRTGRNARIPFDAGVFDFVVACHSIYYVEQGERLEGNLAEVARVMAPGGTLVASFLMPTAFLVEGARDAGQGHVEITNDPLGLRNGAIVRPFDSSSEVASALAPWFDAMALGECRDDYYGLRQDMWIVTCRRR
jgi:SAM-dependent methyltransferase